MRRPVLAALLGAIFALASVPAFAGTAPDLAAAVAAPDRSAEHVALDASRKPAEVLTFLGLKTGDRAADVMVGSGYYTEIMAKAVGPDGVVTMLEPVQFFQGKEKDALDALVSRYPNVLANTYPYEAFEAPGPNIYDFVMMHLIYHDLYWQSEKYGVPKTDPDAFLKQLFIAVKPGGIVGVVDHVGPGGDTRAVVEAEHRIGPATIKADFARAGFVLEAESPLLANPADDHSKGVFDAAIRGKTDRVTYRFRKPS